MNALADWKSFATTGAFTTDQVARLVGARTPEIASWLRGKEPLIQPDYQTIAGRIILSFAALVEARAVAYLLNQGMVRRRIRELQVTLRKKLGDPHPLARDQTIVTDGARAFDASTDGKLVNLLNDCYASPELMRPALHGRVEFRGGRAAWLEPNPRDLPHVRIDPSQAFGRPIVLEGNVAVPTATLADAVLVDEPDAVADWYGVSPQAVREAIAFEMSLAN